MKKKEIFKITFITLMIVALCLIVGINKRRYDYASRIYKVYLNGQELGTIASKEELYNLIDEEQQDIKKTYEVEKVYPPNDFYIEEYNTYDDEVGSVETIYNQIKDKDDLLIYVKNEDIFKEALIDVVTAFVNEEDYKDYINNTQEQIKDVGSLIEQLYFEETITTKPAFISVKEKIYTDVNELTQYLLFGSDIEQDRYTVKSGDTISSIAEDNKLNPSEFLIANPQYKNKDSILAIGDKVNINLINPILTLIEDLHTVTDEEQVYEKKVKYDNTKPSSYSEITTPGVTGIVRITRKVQMVNGEQNQGAEPISQVVIRETIDEVTTKGRKQPNLPPPTGTYVDNGLEWGWPTNRPYIITSDYGYRWGSHHNAIDISGTGFGSPIYASQEGVVVEVNRTCPNVGYYKNQCGRTYGNYVIIEHKDGYYTLYAHMTQSIAVSVGQTVSRAQIIGYMGSSGSSTGTHLHFGVSKGKPLSASYSWLNPWSLFR